ncbi:MAG TPA: beta-N-acetylhexosaminidase [Burkholderiales bacterium]|nr:beta-N-acetylhexosaminidase [Burkholderiales bacterium]
MLNIPLGPVMLDVAGFSLSDEERSVLAHPLVGGVIFFARNYQSPEQLSALTADIRAVRSPSLLIAVDQEGGRVQRFREGFTRLPPMRALGQLFDTAPSAAMNLAHSLGVILATELRAHGVDFSFTPVLDIDFNQSSVIGDRAFHEKSDAIAYLAGELIEGLGTLGVGAVGKHFPGHGFAAADSHIAYPTDERELAAIEATDMRPYRELIPRGLAGIMPAHVIYPKVDARPAGFSQRWLQEILRRRYGFDGLIFSDDLSMEAASVAGGVVERARAALTAGCDMVLVCNAPIEARKLLDGLGTASLSQARAEAMRRQGSAIIDQHAIPAYKLALEALAQARGAGLMTA